jgi:oxaloacetate decarboxylase gamma subunit
METSLPDMLLAGAKLMLIGMGIVYLFLALLVAIIGATAKLLRRYGPETASLPDLVAQAEPGEADVVAAIAAAVHRYRHR